VAAVALGRRAFAAETDPAFADLAAERLRYAGAGSASGLAQAAGLTQAAGLAQAAGEAR
jgi:hypothetical protein